ncbi:MAG: NAD(P)/FAD-dependent oxidoreductase [Candidatus Omnitrophota bacterium]|nr:NAD(P)/FAD-dependent oxidoreductase [Candidatus Omnitrophota bacterium]
MIYDIAVIGGGAAGTMAAIRAGALKSSVCLVERNDSIGRKIMITGKGRCNITNTASIDVFMEKFGPKGEFYRTAFFAFSNEDLTEFFRSRGLELKAERQGRVFPVTDKARSVISVLEDCLKENKVEIIYGARIISVEGRKGAFTLISEGGARLDVKKVIVAAGGASYKATGSTGDGFILAGKAGHAVATLRPALVPLKAKEAWVKDLQGIGLENVRITFHVGKKKIVSEIGEVMFTHFGVSGPLVLDLSGEIMSAVEKYPEIPMTIDLKPGLKNEQLESKLVNKFTVKGNVQMKNLMQDILPKRMIDVFLRQLNIHHGKRTNQITKEERAAIISALKAFKLTITGSLPLEEAMVTGGGVSMKDIDPRTMESKVVPGLYFAGEVIEGSAPSGGYNLQQAFSTGYLAGSHAAS